MHRRSFLLGVIILLAFGAGYFFITSSKKIDEEKIEITPDGFYATSLVELPKKVKETSGLIYYNDLLWTINDSRNEPCIYGLNLSGKLKREICISNAENYDWEAITQSEHHIFIGDIGDNKGQRDSLIIYKIKKNNLLPQQTEAEAETIVFRYHNNIRYINIPFRHPYDCESMIYLEGHLYLFSKDWQTKTSTIYRLPVTPGNYYADSVTTINQQGLITDASFNLLTKDLVLSGYLDYASFFVIYENVTNITKLSNAPFVKYFFSNLYHYQNEGVCFLDKNQIIISNERSGFKESLLFLSSNK